MQTESQAVDRDVYQDLRYESQKKKFWRIFTLILLVVILYNTKKHERWWPDLEDGRIKFECSNWWGFDKQYFYPVWRKETDASAEDVKRWCIMYPDRTWHTFIWSFDDEGTADIFFPPKK